MAILIALHTLAAVVWVGGILFVHFMLRPSLLSLEPPVRLPIWRRVMGRFLPTAGVAAATLVVTGYAMILGPLGGFSCVLPYVHAMTSTGIVMVLIYLHIYFAPWARFKRAVAAADWAAAGSNLATIRRMVSINMALGVATIVIGVTGPYWG